MSSLFVHQKIENFKTQNSEQWRHVFYDKNAPPEAQRGAFF